MRILPLALHTPVLPLCHVRNSFCCRYRASARCRRFSSTRASLMRCDEYRSRREAGWWVWVWGIGRGGKAREGGERGGKGREGGGREGRREGRDGGHICSMRGHALFHPPPSCIHPLLFPPPSPTPFRRCTAAMAPTCCGWCQRLGSSS